MEMYFSGEKIKVFMGVAARCREQTFVCPIQGGSKYKLAFIEQIVSEKVYESMYDRLRKIYFDLKKSREVLSKLKSREFRANSLYRYDFSTLSTTLHHNVFKAFFTSTDHRRYKLSICQNACDTFMNVSLIFKHLLGNHCHPQI